MNESMDEAEEFSGLVEAIRVAIDAAYHDAPPGRPDDVPQDVQDACCEIAFALLDGIDPDLEYENLRMVSQGIGNIRSTYNPEAIPEHILAGVPSAAAWRYLKPYLRDVRDIRVSRV